VESGKLKEKALKKEKKVKEKTKAKKYRNTFGF